MTKDELAGNGYNIDKSYQVLMPFMRPHDSQTDYYERCRSIMDVITRRHQATGGTILLVGRKMIFFSSRNRIKFLRLNRCTEFRRFDTTFFWRKASTRYFIQLKKSLSLIFLFVFD